MHKLGLRETRRRDSEKGRFTLVFLSSGAAGDPAEIELTHNWDEKEPYPAGRFFGHLAFEVEDIHETCARLQSAGVAILRPPRDGRMAFVKSPDGHSIELLQEGGWPSGGGSRGRDAEPGRVARALPEQLDSTEVDGCPFSSRTRTRTRTTRTRTRTRTRSHGVVIDVSWS